MTEREAYEWLFNIDLNASGIRKLWGRIHTDIRQFGVIRAAENLRLEINSQTKKSEAS